MKKEFYPFSTVLMEIGEKISVHNNPGTIAARFASINEMEAMAARPLTLTENIAHMMSKIQNPSVMTAMELTAKMGITEGSPWEGKVGALASIPAWIMNLNKVTDDYRAISVSNLMMKDYASAILNVRRFENTLIDKEIIRMVKMSRLVTNYLKSTLDVPAIEYDFSKVDLTEDGEKSQKLILPKTIIQGAKSIKQIMLSIYLKHKQLFDLHHRKFEELVAELLLSKGYEVELTAQTRDGGKDIIAIKSVDGFPLKYLVECKKWQKDRGVGIEVVRSLCDTVRENGANKGVIFTTSYFTSDARKRQKAQPYLLDLKGHEDIMGWVTDYIVNR